jgi:pSer/pThr/pTyr-binding forkhead associated (FHA) protein
MQEFRLSIMVGKGEGESFQLEPNKDYIVGRDSGCDIKIPDNNISRNHFKIRIKQGKYFITDLGSKNGTFVDGKDLIPGVVSEVKEGSPIVIGMTILGLGWMCELCLKPFLDAAGFDKVVGRYNETERQRRVVSIRKNMEFIYKVNNCLTESKEIEQIFRELINNIFHLLNRIDRCVVISVDNSTGRIKKILYRSKNPVYDPKKLYNKELVEQALVMNEPVMIYDSNNGCPDKRLVKSLQLMKIRSAMCLPIGSCFDMRGVIYIDTLEMPYGFRESDAVLLKDVIGRVALAIDNLAMQMS